MFDKLITYHTLDLIRASLEQIEERCLNINSSDDFLLTPEGVMRLDSICMKLTTVGESIKNLDKITHKELFKQYPEVEWRNVMGVRDIIVHHYFDIDADEIFRICKDDVPELRRVIIRIMKDLKD
jgi:uncharacterized protein with HEPN domain